MLTLRLVSRAVLFLTLSITGCGSDGGGGGGGGGGGADGGGGGGGGADGGGGGGGGQWQTLITGDWQLAPGSENYWCARVTIPETMYVNGFRSIAPNGTHHTVLTIQDAGDDGQFGCSAGTLADEMVFASGVGTDALTFPEGVAIKLEAGRKLLLNLHLYNVSDQAISGTSGTEVKVIPASEVQQEAEMVFGGTFQIYLPPGQQTTLSGRCVFNTDSTVISVWPHMHQVGVHMKVTHEASGGNVVLHDQPFSFAEQTNWPITPELVKAGEDILTECTWDNTTGSAIAFGDSSDAEMCFAGLYRYPKDGSSLFCTDGFTPPGF